MSHLRMWICSPGRFFGSHDRNAPSSAGAPSSASIVEADPGIEIPADEQDLLFRAEHRLPSEPEIIGGIDDQARAVGTLDPPAVVPGFWEIGVCAGLLIPCVTRHGVSGFAAETAM